MNKLCYMLMRKQVFFSLHSIKGFPGRELPSESLLNYFVKRLLVEVREQMICNNVL